MKEDEVGNFLRICHWLCFKIYSTWLISQYYFRNTWATTPCRSKRKRLYTVFFVCAYFEIRSWWIKISEKEKEAFHTKLKILPQWKRLYTMSFVVWSLVFKRMFFTEHILSLTLSKTTECVLSNEACRCKCRKTQFHQFSYCFH